MPNSQVSLKEILIDLNNLSCIIFLNKSINPLTSMPGCIPGSRYTGVGVLFFVI